MNVTHKITNYLLLCCRVYLNFLDGGPSSGILILMERNVYDLSINANLQNPFSLKRKLKNQCHWSKKKRKISSVSLLKHLYLFYNTSTKMCKSSQKKMKKIEYLYSHTVTENFMGAAIITFDPFVRRHPGSLSLSLRRVQMRCLRKRE